MKSFFYFFFPIFKNVKRKWYKYIDDIFKTTVSVLSIIWAIYFFGGKYLFFTNNSTFFDINVYSDKDSAIKINFNSIRTKLLQHKIDIKKFQSDIFIIENPVLYYGAMFPPGIQIIAGKSSGITYGEDIFIKSSAQKLKDIRDAIIAHELVHVWQNKNYTPSLYMHFIIPVWVTEGYAVYASGENRLKEEINKKDFLDEYYHSVNKHWRNDNSYTLWGFMVKHAIEKMHKSVDDLHLGKVEYDEVLDSLLHEYNIAKESK